MGSEKSTSTIRNTIHSCVFGSKQNDKSLFVKILMTCLLIAALSLLCEMSFVTKSCHHNDDHANDNDNDNDNQIHLHSNYTGPQTTFKTWPPRLPFPCVDADPGWKGEGSRRPTTTGLMYVREMKTGSSTLSSVLLRLAHTRGQKLLKKDIDTDDTRGSRHPCRVRLDHVSATRMNYHKRDRKKSYLITMLRDPTKRAVSQYFHFRVSKNKENPTDTNFQAFLTDPDHTYLHNYYMKSLNLNRPLFDEWAKQNNNDTPTSAATSSEHYRNRVIQDILDNYNFIGITERMDESLIVLKMLLGLTFQEILFISAKPHGSFSVGTERGQCIYIVPSFVTPSMAEFFRSDYWHSEYVSGADMTLYKAANVSLDNTIDSLGRREVNRQLRLFRLALDVVNEKCRHRYRERCSSSGEYLGSNGSTCYMWSIGCAYECLNKVDIKSVVS